MVENVLVCVTGQRVCERLIRAGIQFAEQVGNQYQLYVIHIATSAENLNLQNKAAQELEYIFDIAKGYGATTSMQVSSKIKETIINYAKKKKIHRIVLGETRLAQQSNSVNQQIINDCKDLGMFVHIIPIGYTGEDS